MILAVGIDIVETGRLRSAVSRWGDRFLERVFTESERSYCFCRKDPIPCLAARFAAKEAMIKALSGIDAERPSDTGQPFVLVFRQIEVCNAPSGRPFIRLTQTHGRLLSERGLTAHLSLSHELTVAVALVVLERTDRQGL